MLVTRIKGEPIIYKQSFDRHICDVMCMLGKAVRA